MIRNALDCLAWTVASVALAFAILFAIATVAPARDLGQWDGSDPEMRAWFQGLRQPDNKSMSCCGEADAYFADSFVVEDGTFFAIVTDDRPDEPLGRPHVPVGTRVAIPPNKIMREGSNPTGHFVLFLSSYGMVYCYVTGSLI